jgi:talin
VSSAELLKGSDWVDPDDPTVIAENELLGAASSIDAAAKKLASLQPRRTSIRVSFASFQIRTSCCCDSIICIY